ncbi:SCO family protein [Candidatus Methylopumilus universalis]|jgi:protein SCO1/2|uniref:SCO family protein n=1 Tax=Candidatus Methylopumilus universalis TaxID=2588536 RepID=A0AAX1F057_9PROT|nr:SCO family protein [Candidatus Methylopumilus universalis]QDC41417.1 SCO family protein [Candidatus Methylopumilus universalis]QDC42699.1 SCO family protein [Candidatus Methylopumilus universalis]QDC55086.1 SCO family protein [Candidatus Methylopumilus universalis]QDC56367.1 SCO family protein [Candidatus Methylopumilus universalis]QDC57656.1 SCO family protein [Candidatus Methylopumilus universalis]
MKKIVLLFLILICLVSCQNSNQQTFVGTDISSVRMDTTFSLKDFNGRIRTLEDFKGKVVVLFFGFTHCPDICPTTLTDLKKTMVLLKDKASAVQVIFITLDPVRDTEDVLKKFIPTFNSSFLGLTGTENDIDKVANQLKIFNKKVNDGSKAGYTIDHSAGLYVIDKKGSIKLHISNGQKPEDLASDLAKLI